MPSNATVFSCVVHEDGGATMLARIVGNAGTNITIATISAITCNVYDLVLGGTAIVSPTVTVATSVFDTVQTDAIWTADTIGYNFKHDLPATSFPVGGHTYRIEYKFTPVSGQVFFEKINATALETLQS